LACAEIQKVCQYSRSLWRTAVFEVMPDFGQEEILLVACIAQIW
jgi:hypothetical protein